MCMVIHLIAVVLHLPIQIISYHGTQATAQSASGTTFNITVYPTNMWHFHMTVFWDKRTWLEAIEMCNSKGMALQSGWNGSPLHDYVMAHALTQNRQGFEGLWLADLKPKGTDTWYWAASCGEHSGGADVIENISDDVLCFLINATAEMDSNIYGVSCDHPFAYVCRSSATYYTKVVMLHNQTRMVHSTLWETYSFSNLTLDDCIKELFRLQQVLAEFTVTVSELGTCGLYKDYPYELPVEVVLTSVNDDVIIITGPSIDISFDEDHADISLTSNEYPCKIAEEQTTQTGFETTTTTGHSTVQSSLELSTQSETTNYPIGYSTKQSSFESSTQSETRKHSSGFSTIQSSLEASTQSEATKHSTGFSTIQSSIESSTQSETTNNPNGYSTIQSSIESSTQSESTNNPNGYSTVQSSIEFSTQSETTNHPIGYSTIKSSLESSTHSETTNNPIGYSTVYSSLESSTQGVNTEQNTIDDSYCNCFCPIPINKTEEEIQQKLFEIETELTVSKEELSVTRRSKTSAADERPLCKAMGSVAIIVLIAVVLVLVLFDISHCYKIS